MGNKEPPSRRLTDTGFQAKRDKGLCFRCNEKYTTNHRCNNRETRELRVLLVSDCEEIKLVQSSPIEEITKAQSMEVEDLSGP